MQRKFLTRAVILRIIKILVFFIFLEVVVYVVLRYFANDVTEMRALESILVTRGNV